MPDVFSRSVAVLPNGGFALKPGRLIVRDPSVAEIVTHIAQTAQLSRAAALEAFAKMLGPQEAAPAAHVSGVGLSCDTCHEPNEYAQANMEGGAFRCYRCRSVWA